LIGDGGLDRGMMSFAESGRESRVTSLDALRGLVVFTGILSSLLAPVLFQFRSSALSRMLARELSPSLWHGITASDFILPLFLFVAGAAIVPAFTKRGVLVSYRRHAMRIARRILLLCVIGLVVEGGLFQNWPDFRLVGTFQRIAVCYAVAAVIYLTIGWRFQAGALAFLLIIYGLVLEYTTTGESGSPYSFGGNVAANVDRLLLPGRKYFGTWDPQGILTTVPAIAITIAGLLAGRLLGARTVRSRTRTLWLLGSGFAAIDIGFLLDGLIPINSYLWTPSFSVVTVGAGLLLLGLLNAGLNGRRCVFPVPIFIALGRNSLLVVLLTLALVQASERAARLETRSVWVVPHPVAALLIAVVVGLVAFLLDRRKIYIGA
jgi:predicted acyltransferase